MPDTSTALFLGGVAAAIFAASYVFGNKPSESAKAGAPREITEDHVSLVAVIVPNVDRAVIRKDLEKTRSIEATTLRLLEKQKAETPKSQPSDEEIVAQSEQPKPDNWVEDRAQRELHRKQQREKMLAQARIRTRQLAETE